MTRLISLLRGINVSGQKKILMADLKGLYEDIGCHNVKTYIQSGNVVFDFPENDINLIKSQLEKEIENTYSFQVPVDIRHKDEFLNIYNRIPFKNIDLEKDGSKILVGFLSSAPVADKIDALRKYQNKSEELIIMDSTLYLHCPNGFGKSKLSVANIEKNLNVIATTRNLKTVAKLCSLAQENG